MGCSNAVALQLPSSEPVEGSQTEARPLGFQEFQTEARPLGFQEFLICMNM